MKIGTILREEREKRNLTLEDVSKETLIRVYYLEKIENDDFGEEFDGYILSYIKKYAEFLNIDDKPLVEAYKELFKEKDEIKRVSTRKKPNYLIISLISILLILAIVLTIYFVKKPKSEIPTQNIQPPSTETPISEKPTETNPTQPQTQPTQPTQNQTKEAPIVVVLQSNGRCWLGINSDGKYTQRFINANETLKLTANNYIQIRFGNAKVVKINYNGKDLGFASTKETVVDYKFTKEGFTKVGNQ